MNTTGKKYGGRKKGTPNKLTAEVKEKIKHLLDGAIDSINLSECTTAERIRLIEIGLRYTLPTMKQVEKYPETEYHSIDFKNLIKWVD
ncbi:MAG: hypothetical protein P8N93_05540 [Flavobacteriaceae bacterium]|nr:hypothetical protein [Flavobacteriaceae bacterium]